MKKFLFILSFILICIISFYFLLQYSLIDDTEFPDLTKPKVRLDNSFGMGKFKLINSKFCKLKEKKKKLISRINYNCIFSDTNLVISSIKSNSCEFALARSIYITDDCFLLMIKSLSFKTSDLSYFNSISKNLDIIHMLNIGYHFSSYSFHVKKANIIYNKNYLIYIAKVEERKIKFIIEILDKNKNNLILYIYTDITEEQIIHLLRQIDFEGLKEEIKKNKNGKNK